MQNYTDRDGAHVLANRIAAFWRERGYEVDVECKPAGFDAKTRATRYDVRSDLRNGFPRRICASNEARQNRR